MRTRTTVTIEALKREFSSLEDFTGLLDRFFDCIESDAELTRSAEPYTAPRLHELLAHVAAEMVGGEVVVLLLRLLRVPKHRLVHGSGTVSGRLACVVWFEDLRQGLLAVAMGGEMRYARFTEVGAIPPPADPAVN